MYRLFFILFIFLNSGSLFANTKDQKIHDELRQLLKGIENAVNSENYSALPQYFHKNMRVTMSNQEVLKSHKDIGKFFNFWFGKNGYLDHVEIKLTPDTLTELYANKTMGIVCGSGIENTYLSDSRFFPIKTRWTATVIKNDKGKWKILSLHIGVDFLNNPVLDMAKKSGKYFALIGTIIGLIIGLLFGFILWRKKNIKREI